MEVEMAALTARGVRHAHCCALIAALVAGRTAAGQADGRLLAPPARAGTTAGLSSSAGNTGGQAARGIQVSNSESALKVSKGQGVLPNDHGQIWREYDISPYTLRVRDVARPEQAIVDWILRETGTE